MWINDLKKGCTDIVGLVTSRENTNKPYNSIQEQQFTTVGDQQWQQAARRFQHLLTGLETKSELRTLHCRSCKVLQQRISGELNLFLVNEIMNTPVCVKLVFGLICLPKSHQLLVPRHFIDWAQWIMGDFTVWGESMCMERGFWIWAPESMDPLSVAL